jgi:uncharacterized protein
MATGTVTGAETGTQGLQVTVSKDRLSVVLSCAVDVARGPQALDSIRAVLESKKITAPPIAEQFAAAVETAQGEGKSIVDVVIASGTPALPPKDARLEWSKDYFASGYYVDPVTQYVDYHRKAAAPAVGKDELIAKVIPSEPGQDGQDVFGAAISAAKPRPLEYRAGTHVIFDEAANCFRADCAGRVKLNGKMIEVHDVFQVADSVGPNTGNIDHGGSVIIRGGIDSEFKVRALGDVEVQEVIGAADIECGGNLVAGKGISSAPGKKIVVKGNLHAKYLEHATVFSEGDVIIESEILDSSIRTTGQVICSGRVQGGDITAARGIRVGEAGSKSESRTVLIAGVDYRVVNEMREATDKSKQLKEIITKLEIEQKRLTMLGSTINHKQREVLTEVGFKLFEAQETYSQLTELRKSLAPKMLANRDAIVVIERQVNPGTVLRVLDAHKELGHALLGPIAAAIDPVTKELTLTSYDQATKE